MPVPDMPRLEQIWRRKCTEAGKVLETVTGNANRLLQESGDNAVDVRMDTTGINFKKIFVMVDVYRT